MEFSEAREWRMLLDQGSGTGRRHVHGSGTSSGGGKWSSPRKRCLVDPEIEARLYAVEELLDLSPERCCASVAIEHLGNSAVTALDNFNPSNHILHIQERDAANGAEDIPSLARATTADVARAMPECEAFCKQPHVGLSAQVVDSAAAVEKLGIRREDTKRDKPYFGMVGVSPRTTNGPSVAHAATPTSQLPSENCVRRTRLGTDWAEAEEETTNSPVFFIRRSPEEYMTLDCPESALTALLRTQPSQAEGGGSGSCIPEAFNAVAACVTRQFPTLSDQNVDLRIHLPPYDESAAVSMTVPAAMRVADLLDELVRKHAGREGISANMLYELRLYDEDEEEPDHDCAPFDEMLDIGCLNVKDVALCANGPRAEETSTSPPLSSASRSAAVLGPATLGLSSCQNAVVETSGADGGKGLHVNGIPLTSLQTKLLTTNVAEVFEAVLAVSGNKPLAGVGPTLAPVAERPLRKVSDSDVNTEKQRVFSHRRTRSSPLDGVNADPLVTVGGFETLVKSVKTDNDNDNAAKSTADDASGTQTQTRRLELCLVDGLLAAQADGVAAAAAAGGRGFAVASTSTCGGSRNTGASLICSTFSDGSGLSSGVKAGTVSPVVQAATSSFASAGPVQPSGDDNSGGALVLLHVREDATLNEVLEQLSHEQGRHFDPVSLAFERLDDGIRQRLDLHMQVRHLPPHSSVLSVVRKDTPMLALPPHGPAGSLHPVNKWHLDPSTRRFPSVFAFSEASASVATEYFVKVTVRGSRSRPSDCALVVDRDRIHHRACSKVGSSERSEGKRTSFMSPLLRKLGKHLHSVEAAAHANAFVERRVCDVLAISCDERQQRAFVVTYSSSGPGAASELCATELVYEAQTPTECADIVARLQYLKRSLRPD
eukprot:TRINITY_DN37676_c0_g1_i1.p1 TRINITY_DN37676_c0_g1~~TRINITY_DN37676_c0_g1_i1.p1  ORF type:complete len:885 (-),score=136.10 TRINITY_DN37676_c0_g1_i1:37-2691(-)